MGVSAGRGIMYVLGIALVIGAVVMFFAAADLDRWIPTSMLVAGILLIIGLAVMGFASDAPEERHGHHDSGESKSNKKDITVVK
jgi:hypothetical protein